jgi:predicted RND superfamily exporter protein
VEQSIKDFHSNPAFSSIAVDVSGGVPFVYRTQRQLLVDLLSSFTSAFIMIAISMAILFRSITAGLLTMLPNVTPALIVFGIMGWLNMEVEIGTVLTASVMMGVCVDDTLHLISHFRSLRGKGLSHVEATHEAISNCGGAMLQTALVCGLGMLAFALSPFTPVARFAWLTFSLLTVGLISDLIVTPAILLSPLHHMFFWTRQLKQDTGITVPTEIMP